MSIDVELSSIDINQCDSQDSSLTDSRGKNGNSDRTGSTDSVKLLDFLGTHKCKKSTQVRLNTTNFPVVYNWGLGVLMTKRQTVGLGEHWRPR